MMEKDSPRKRPRENETPSQRLKREKAAERQRRKRERDRAASALPPPAPGLPPLPSPPQHDDSNLSPDEQARRERVRAAARERQRKHRQLVKARKMRELGLDMGNEIMTGVDDYRVGDGQQYQQHQLLSQAHAHHLAQAQAQQGHPPQQTQGEPPFPQQAANNGQTFATTLLVSFACAPALKQNLLSILNITNDELASLEPFIAEAWDRWDQAVSPTPLRPPRRLPPGGVPVPQASTSASPSPTPSPGAALPPAPYATGTGPPAPDDFRARFQRAAMAVPASFRATDFADGAASSNNNNNFNGAQNGNGGERDGTPSSGAAANGQQGQDGIDPHLGAHGKEGEGRESE
ncbi:hypothetical protein B0H13DRAFT_2231620 [Mycena leptocephala]|nr:hypothetical protein B0H13DRAFT_2231620 [Mycena leptocephala]